MNLYQNENPLNQILIGYNSKSSKEFDLGVDGKAFDINNSMIYTTINNEKYVINGRGNFDVDDVFNLGFKANAKGLYSITIENKAGAFENTPIYLKDNFTGSVTNLNTNNYMFISEEGDFEKRFEIFYTQKQNNIVTNNSFYVYSEGNNIFINSSDKEISHLTIHDISGRILYNQPVNKNTFSISTINKNNTVLIIDTHFKDGSNISRKMIH